MRASLSKSAVLLLCLAGLAANGLAVEGYSWQEVPAVVKPTGDLAWKPEPFRFEAADSVRYIDFEGGSDSAAGTGKDSAWKHHPWDPAATGKAATCSGVHTYVFKRGVTYRGALVAMDSGRPGNPIRLTSDPSWGQGEAVISGSQLVTGWQKGADRQDIPEAGQVWVAALDFAPRRLWMVEGDGSITRIPIARTPNWTVSDPEDVLSEWWEWENPEWWVADKRTTTVNDKKMHLGIDTKHLTREADYYKDALVWTEWAIVMGTPFPTQVEAVDAQKKSLSFQGRWWGESGQINTGNRYFLEDKPQYLDAAGEFWFDKQGEGGRLYVRLPGDRDPGTVSVEAARHYNLVQDQASLMSPLRMDVIGEEGRARVNITGVSHVAVSGLQFRFNNVWWDLYFPPWMHKEVDAACIRLLGSSDDVCVSNCRFLHVTKAVRMDPLNDKARIGSVVVRDNDIQYTDSSAINISAGPGSLRDVRVLRNNLFMIGMRPYRQSDGHALRVSFPETMEIAGNMLRRTYGSGIFVFGGKGSGRGGDVPLARNLVHHNRAEQTLLAANDWGGIETWQGGPFYVYSNISANPNGLWNWAWRNQPYNARLGFAYYLDGSFKNYLFNNIAWGLSSDPASKLCNRAAFQQATPTIHNAFFNNTAYRFANGSNWSPAGGHHRFLGNVYSDMSSIVFNHGRLKEDPEDIVAEEWPYHLVAYAHNVFYGVKKMFGVFEASGRGYEDFHSFRQALKERQSLNAGLGVTTDSQPLRDPANRDVRPARGSAAIDAGVKFFVPWGLARMVGEWGFYPVGNDVTQIPDEHWYMQGYFGQRTEYRNMPQYPLTAVNCTADSYVQGDLEDWIAGALKLNGRDQYATVSQADLPDPGAAGPDADLQTVDVRDSSFILEIYLKTEPGAGKAVLIRKMDAQAGYALTLDGAVTFAARAGGKETAVSGKAAVNDGKWHHVLAEADRAAGRMTIYVDGRQDAEGAGPGDASLSNGADFYVGGTPDGACLAGTVDFARVSLGSFAEARTTIEELYEWQFNGPFLRDFCGNAPTGKARDAGAIELRE